jgi:hypothetical protein
LDDDELRVFLEKLVQKDPGDVKQQIKQNIKQISLSVPRDHASEATQHAIIAKARAKQAEQPDAAAIIAQAQHELVQIRKRWEARLHDRIDKIIATASAGISPKLVALVIQSIPRSSKHGDVGFKEFKAWLKLVDPHSVKSQRQYVATVKTGDKRFAGTDAAVWIRLTGAFQSSPDIELVPKAVSKQKGILSRGCVNAFKFETIVLQDITTLDVWHDDSGLGSSWYCESIEIKEVGGQPSGGDAETICFACNDWLGKYSSDGKLKRTLLRTYLKTLVYD